MPVYLFHYTDRGSLCEIEEQGYIRRTAAGEKHAHHGSGVYLTTLGPRTDRQRLIFNNYRVENADRHRCPNLWAKTSAFVRIPKDDLDDLVRVYDDHDLHQRRRIIYVNRRAVTLAYVRYKTGFVIDEDDSH